MDDFYIPLQKTFGQLIISAENYSDDQSKIKICIHGFPFDEGTRRNGGRVGGEKAPQALRNSLQKISIFPTQEMINNTITIDTGDLPKQDVEGTELSLETAHQHQTQKVQQILELGTSYIPFLIGGSNDQSYCNVKALLNQYPEQRLAVINLDAHFDVRPLKLGLAHSGSPFRQMLEDPAFIKNDSIFIEFASKGASTSNAHYQYLIEKKCEVYWLEKHIRRTEVRDSTATQAGTLMKRILEKLYQQVDYIFFSFDVDCIDSQFCPGVSAPSVVGGLSELEALELCYIAGMNDKVRIIDFSEFNPAVEFLRTSQLLSNMFYQFCKGVSNRQSCLAN